MKPIWLRLRLYLLLALMFAIVYALVAIVASFIGISGFLFYGVLAFVLVFIQYMVGPKMIEWSMRVTYVSEHDYPWLHQMIEGLARKAQVPKPKIGIANIPIPNAFAFGRWGGDGRVCVTRGIMDLLTREELRSVLGHEISHLEHRDVTIITMLSIIPLICWYIAWTTMFAGDERGGLGLLGLFAFMFYFITNLLVLYGSRIREYYADLGSIDLGSKPHHLASALYKLVYGSAKIPRENLRQVEGLKAFFANDPSRARTDIAELKEIDLDMSGTIDAAELHALATRPVQINWTDKLMELLSTHPNMLKRVKHLASLAET